MLNCCVTETNVLLSFAQFEREVTGERIRDKIAASKRKGMWMGGNVPLGYDANQRTLVINPAEAETVRRVFALYRELGCVRRVKSGGCVSGFGRMQHDNEWHRARRQTLLARSSLHTALEPDLHRPHSSQG